MSLWTESVDLGCKSSIGVRDAVTRTHPRTTISTHHISTSVIVSRAGVQYRGGAVHIYGHRAHAARCADLRDALLYAIPPRGSASPPLRHGRAHGHVAPAAGGAKARGRLAARTHARRESARAGHQGASLVSSSWWRSKVIQPQSHWTLADGSRKSHRIDGAHTCDGGTSGSQSLHHQPVTTIWVAASI